MYELVTLYSAEELTRSWNDRSAEPLVPTNTPCIWADVAVQLASPRCNINRLVDKSDVGTNHWVEPAQRHHSQMNARVSQRTTGSS